MQRAFNSIFFFTLSLATLSCLIPLSLKAQVTPDGTTSTTVNQDGNNFTIEQGDRVGDNLFHSFNQFSVPTLGSAAFNNAGDIANIFSRVTGSSISSIDGLISANGAANLFLINPNGIIFGENASLNLGGSFFASTADSLLFEGNTEFSAANPQAPPLLEVSIPIGANFRDNPGDITVNQSILEVSPGKNLALVGGNLSIEGGELGLIAAPGGRIELGGLSAAGEVEINENNSLTFPENVARGDVTLSNLALIDVSSDEEGSIAVNANNLELSGASSLEGGIASDLGNANAQAGDINLNATGEISLRQSSQVVNRVNENAIGNAGNIFVNATDGINLSGDSSIDASIGLGGQGNAGEITINAGNNISLDGSLTSIAANLTFATGRGGKIKITGESLNLDNGAVIDAGNTLSQGAGGNIQINVSDSVSLQEGASIVSNSSGSGGDGGDITIQAGGDVTLESSSLRFQSRISTATGGINLPGIIDTTGNTGEGGDIKIISNSLILKNYALIFASTFGEGDAGNINVEVTDSVIGQGTSSFLSSLTNGAGNAGKITINAGNRVSFDGAGSGINTGTLSEGQGSDIEITTSSLTLSNLASLLTSTNGGGNGGSIQVNANSISLNSSAQIDSSTEARGDAGNIEINANDSVVLNEDTKLRSAALTQSKGEPGNIEVKTRSLLVNNDAQVTVASQGEGSGGNLFIEADSLTLDRNGSINASTISGTGGNITLLADILSLRNNSNISAQALEDANGGNITTDADLIIAFPNQNNDIFANATQGNGGNINITTQGIFGLEERSSTPPNQTNDIDASSEFGLQGTFSLNTPDFDPTTGLINLPASVGDASDQISQNPCEQGVGSEFIITGKGGLPPTVNESLNSESAQVSLIKTVTSQPQTVGAFAKLPKAYGIRPKNPSTPEAVPAQGWVFNDKGEVTLTAYSTSGNKIQRSRQQQPTSCSSRIAP